MLDDGDMVVQQNGPAVGDGLSNYDLGDGSHIPIIQKQIKRVAIVPGALAAAAAAGSINAAAVKANEKQVVISKLRGQNDKLKAELKMLTGKLETFIDKSRQRKHKQMFGVAGHEVS